MNLPSDLTLAYQACKAVSGPDNGMFCYSWIDDSYKLLGVAPWHLKKLAKKGYLKREWGSRGGSRAYYRLNPDLPHTGPWEPAVQKIVALQHLGDDWDGQGAQAPSEEVLKSAIGLAYTLYQQGVDPPSRVVAGLEGSVIFEWQDADGTYTEVEVVGWLIAEVMLIEPGQPAKHWTLRTEQRSSSAQ